MTTWTHVFNILNRPLPATTARNPVVRMARIAAVQAAAFATPVRPCDDVRSDMRNDLPRRAPLAAFDALPWFRLRRGPADSPGHYRSVRRNQLLIARK
jgi:hypothetical protein